MRMSSFVSGFILGTVAARYLILNHEEIKASLDELKVKARAKVSDVKDRMDRSSSDTSDGSDDEDSGSEGTADATP